MNTFLYFPEHIEDAKITILGAPYDLNSSSRYGSRFAPNSIRKESRDMESNYLGRELSGLPVEDIGNLRTDGWNTLIKDMETTIPEIIAKGSVPVIMGGDHSITPEIIKTMNRKDISVVAIDAHLDFDVQLNGNTHSHSTPRRREAKMLGAENIYLIGIRSWPTTSMEDARRMGVNIFTSEDVYEKGMDDIISSLPDGDVYLTIDIDGIDPAYAPGTGTPEPHGLTPLDVAKVIRSLSRRMVGMDVVEVCPPCDINGITSSIGAHLIAEFISSFFSR